MKKKKLVWGGKIITMQPLLSDIYLPSDVILHQSWGWNLVDNHLLHNGDSQGNYPQLNNAPKYQVYIYLDAQRMTRLPISKVQFIVRLNVVHLALCPRLARGYESFWTVMITP